MSIINIRESLNRLDLQTDNKYDLRNTYDCNNISNDKKKKLAEALNKNASAKEVSKLLSEDYDDFDPKYDARYEVNAYYGSPRKGNYAGLEDDFYTDDFEEVKDWVWEKCQKGLYINVVDRENGNEVNINTENYDFESDDAYRVFDDLDKLSPLSESLNEEDNFDSDEYEREHIIHLVKSVKEASKRKGMNISNLKKTVKRYIENHKDTKNKKELGELIKVYKSLDKKEESLKEDFEDGINFEETDFNDSEVEEGDTFIEDGREWSWIERIAEPIHLDFDNWSVWSARDWGYIEEKVKSLLINKKEFNVEILTKIYDEAEVAYFVVDEDTGFIEWGPVETSTEAQDFLNGKVEDYENGEEYEEIEVEEESLTESRAIRNDGDYEVTLHYDDIGNGKEYDYTLDYDEVVDYLRELALANGDGPEDLNEDEYLEWVMDNFDELSNKYELNVLNYFESEASQYEYDHRYDEP